MKKIALAILALWAVFCVAACSPAKGKDWTLTDEYVVVYASNDLQARSAARRIASAYKESTGGTLSVVPDSEETAEKEILVGEVAGRECSYYLPRMARSGGWYAGAIDDDLCIVTDTGSYDEAVSAFSQYFIGTQFTQDTGVSSSADYAVGNVKVQGKPLAFYDILYTEGSVRAQAAAKTMQAWVLENTGYELPVAGYTQKQSGYNFCFGKLDEAGRQPEACMYDEYTVSFGENFIGVVPQDGITTDDKYYTDSVNSFLSHCFLTGEENVVLAESGVQVLKCWEYLNTHQQTEPAEEEQTIADGVTTQKITLTGSDGKVVVAYVLRAQAGGAWEARVATHPEYTQENPVVSNALNTAQLAQKAGEDVLFCCNAGFFRMNDGNHPEGVLIVDGKVFSWYSDDHLGGTEQAFFGIGYDGSFVIGDRDALNEEHSQLRYATGGRGILLKNGELYDICYAESDALGENVHPRTSVGVTADGGLVVVVADGRQEGYSYGMNLCDMALLLKSFGAVDAINLDGGGSSTFVTKGTDGTLSVLNRPSDGSLRSVGDCLMLVAA